MICRKCGAPLADGASSCHSCGTKAGEGYNFCPQCGQETEPTSSFCGSCGAKIQPMSKSKVGEDYTEPERPAPRASSGSTSGGRFGAGSGTASAPVSRGGNGGVNNARTGRVAPKSNRACVARIHAGGSGTTTKRGTAAERLRASMGTARRASAPARTSTPRSSTYTYSRPSAGAGLNGKNKVVAILLCLFLGFGIYHFYLGEAKKGITKLALTIIGLATEIVVFPVVVGIFTLIDLIKLITNKYVVNGRKWF